MKLLILKVTDCYFAKRPVIANYRHLWISNAILEGLKRTEKKDQCKGKANR